MNFFKTDFITCKPLSNIQDLLQWPFESNNKNGCREFKTEKLFLSDETDTHDQKRNQIIVCHDMKNNYLEDKFLQGFDQGIANYSFYHWNLIDIFIYFSHHFITIPPESWINCAHENNCRILGTFITEWDQGKKICEFLDDRNKINQVVQKLCDICVMYGFDGWLVNIENEIKNVENLKYFLTNLRNSLHKINPRLYKVVWYDSVIVTGELRWQNELNAKNKPFFDLCDAFFVNYTWKEDNLLATKQNSAERLNDIYVGVDVFGRNQLGGGGFNCNLAFEIIQKFNLNIALFAPGWLYECHDKEKFIENSEKFWKLLENYVTKKCIQRLPLVTTFSHGCAKHFFVKGKRIAETNNNGWYNLNVQSLLPALHESKYLEWHFEDAFYGGNCVLVKTCDDIVNVYNCNLKLTKNQNYLFDYVFKEIENDSKRRVKRVKSQSHNESKEFYMILKYQTSISSSSDSIVLANESFENDFVSVNFEKQQVLEESWQRRSFLLSVKVDDLKVIELGLVNKACWLKLGMIRFLDKIIEVKSFLPKFDLKTKTFLLSKRAYFCIDLQWQKCNEITKYYNIYMDENVENDSTTQNIRLIGSSKIPKYSTCIKINENFELNPVSFSNQLSLKINMYIQAIDECLDNVISAGPFNSLDNSFIKISLPLNGINARNDDFKTVNFFDEIIYDFEAFE